MKKLAEALRSRGGKIAILSILTGLYLAGIVCLFFNVSLGVLLWGAALLPSLVLFLYQRREERARMEREADAAKAAAENQRKA